MVLLGEMTTELLGLAAVRRQEPADDVASMLATTVLDGDSLDDGELGMFLIQLLVAGNETTRHAVSGGIAALAEHPEQWERLRADRSLVPTAVDEVLRWTTPVISFLRTATVDTVLGGTEVAAGDPLLLLYASADRDEEVFGPDAGRFDVGRSPNPHLAFGFGTHFCLGAALARLELAVVLEGLLDRFDTVEPAGPVERTGSPVIAGLRRVPVAFGRAVAPAGQPSTRRQKSATMVLKASGCSWNGWWASSASTTNSAPGMASATARPSAGRVMRSWPPATTRVGTSMAPRRSSVSCGFHASSWRRNPSADWGCGKARASSMIAVDGAVGVGAGRVDPEEERLEHRPLARRGLGQPRPGVEHGEEVGVGPAPGAHEHQAADELGVAEGQLLGDWRCRRRTRRRGRRRCRGAAAPRRRRRPCRRR